MCKSSYAGWIYSNSNERDLEKERTMGRKFTVPYALYRAHGFINPHLAEQTGFDDQDLTLFLKALEQMFESDRSAARGEMSARQLILFKHESKLGNAPAHRLFERVSIAAKPANGAVRNFSDYQVAIDEAGLQGVSVQTPF